MKKHLIGVISDTHNLLRPEAIDALKDVELILHAGDICLTQILDELQKIAPVIAVRGNNDKGAWAEEIPIFRTVKLGQVVIYMIHNLKELTIDPADIGINVVISGHTHRPVVEKRRQILYLNPGSAGRKRFKLPVALARLTVTGAEIDAEIVELPV